MRLDGNHYQPHRSSESLSRGGSLEDNNIEVQHNRHQSNSNSDNSTTHETSNEHPFINKNDQMNHSNLPSTSNVSPSQFTESNVSDNQIQTPYSRDLPTQNLGHQSHHIPKNSNDQNSNTQLSEMNSDEEDDDEEEEGGQYNQERSVGPTTSNCHPPLASANSNYENMPYNYSTSSGANALLNRYMEQTIRNLHEFQDVRNLSTSASSMSAISQSMNMPSHTQNT